MFWAGVIAALLTPLTMTIGFIIWDTTWKGSAYALNLFKCSLASAMFIVMVASMGNNPVIFSIDALMLMLSSLLGIVIGDNTWLLALQLLGARRVIIVDSLKPFLAAILSAIILGEPITMYSVFGMFLTGVGVLVVSLEETKDATTDSNSTNIDTKNDWVNSNSNNNSNSNSVDSDSINRPHETSNRDISYDKVGTIDYVDDIELVSNPLSSRPRDNNSSDGINSSHSSNDAEFSHSNSDVSHTNLPIISGVVRGYLFAVLNVAFDAYGSVLTKQFGYSYTVPEITLIRFGFASIVMGVVAIVAKLSSLLYYNYSNELSIRKNFIVMIENKFGTGKKRTKTDRDFTKLETNDSQEFVEISLYSVDEYDSPEPVRNSSSTPTHQGYNDHKEIVDSNNGHTNSQLWYNMPWLMGRKAWTKIAVGVVFVTYLSTLLSNYALFQMNVGLSTTLTSLGPIYSLPLVYLMKNEKTSVRGIIGTLVAVAGVVILCLAEDQ